MPTKEDLRGYFKLANPMERYGTSDEKLTDYMMGGFSFWFLIIINGILLLATLVSVILVVITDFTTGFQLSGANYKDARSFNMFPYEGFLGGIALYGIGLALGGSMLFGSPILRWLIALTFGIGSFLGSLFLLLPQIKSWGRLHNCLNADKGTTFCKDETGWLVAVGIITLVMFFIGFANIIWAILVLFVKRVQEEAAGHYTPWLSKTSKGEAYVSSPIIASPVDFEYRSQRTNPVIRSVARGIASQSQ